MKWAGSIFFAVLIAIVAYISYGEYHHDLPDAPDQDIYVADFASMIGANEREKMLSIGQDLDDRFGAQLVVVTLDTSLEDESIEDYANRLFRGWGIGNAEKNNGVLLLIAKEDRKFRIEVGYGLEGAITDGYAGEVLDGMKAKFRDDKYSLGTLEAYQKLAAKIYENYGAEPPQSVRPAPPPAQLDAEAEEDEEETTWWEDILYCGIFLILVLVVAFLFYGVLGPLISVIVLFAISIFIYILSVLLYIITLGRWGSLKWSDVSGDDKGGGSWWSGGSGGSSGGGSSGGYGGGSSGGGGASGGW